MRYLAAITRLFTALDLLPELSGSRPPSPGWGMEETGEGARG